jgi:FixJ family two-component response regulator
MPVPANGFFHNPEQIANSHAAPTVFVVDGDVLVRKSLEALIHAQNWQPETFCSAREFLAHPRPTTPSCLILAFSSLDSSSLEVQQIIAKEWADTPIIIIVGCCDIPTTVQAMKTGAVDVLVKPFGDEVLLAAIGQSLARSRVAMNRGVEMRALRTCYASLTPRERQVMALVASGLLNKEVGAELGISEITVKAHRGQVMQKMMADSLAHLVNMTLKLRVARPMRSTAISM